MRILLSAAAMILLAGCGGLPQAQVGTQPPGIAPGGPVGAIGSTDLLYAAGQHFGYVFTYPAGKLVGSFPLRIHRQQGYSNGLCSDSGGDVFLTVFSASFVKIFEYAHGGTKPIAELRDPQPTPIGCASDPTSGNLAVTNSFPTEGLESVAIYKGTQGKAKLYYSIPEMHVLAFCAYHNAGDLFVDGKNRTNGRFALAELPKGSGTFQSITVKGLDTRKPGNLQWIGNYLTVAVPTAHRIYTLQVSGTTGTIVGTTVLHRWDTRTTVQSWIDGNTVIAPRGLTNETIAFWNYPQGGKPVKTLRGFAAGYIHGVTVSTGQGR
ncbi:MAG TPA: hypothetical protein VMT95_05480 [Candidatus Binatia bacterium]|nr:hypothetical protein [Candidatus Binatia bacterium]